MAGAKDRVYEAITKNKAMSTLLAKAERRIKKGDKFSRDVENAIREFRPEAGEKEKQEFRKKLYFAKIYYGVSPSEYFLFRFDTISEEKRRTFVGSYEKDRLCSKINTNERNKLADKYEAYQTFKPYYHREVIKVDPAKGFDEFEAFAKKHKSFMIKAIRKAKGHDVFRIDMTGEEQIPELEEKMRSLGLCVVEECLVQAKEMAALHPQSVNTIRYASFFDDGKLTRMFAMLRMGCGESRIDNAGMGGIVTSVDVETGIAKTNGNRENGEQYEKHPDTNITIKGFQVPRWDELSALIEELVRVVPGQKFIGWDMALTDDGWVMVEGNSRPMLTGVQNCEQKGVRELINKTLVPAAQK